MINFKELQNQIVEHITTTYHTYLPVGIEPINQYVNDQLDLDKYKNNNTLFCLFPNYTFSRETNESELTEIIMSVFIVVRNNTPEILKDRMLDYTTAFYDFFKQEYYFNGIIDYGYINNVIFYEYPEANHSIKVAEIDCILHYEA